MRVRRVGPVPRSAGSGRDGRRGRTWLREQWQGRPAGVPCVVAALAGRSRGGSGRAPAHRIPCRRPPVARSIVPSRELRVPGRRPRSAPARCRCTGGRATSWPARPAAAHVQLASGRGASGRDNRTAPAVRCLNPAPGCASGLKPGSRPTYTPPRLPAPIGEPCHETRPVVCRHQHRRPACPDDVCQLLGVDVILPAPGRISPDCWSSRHCWALAARSSPC